MIKILWVVEMGVPGRPRKGSILGYGERGARFTRAAGQIQMIAVSEEGVVDFERTARIANEAFGSKDVTFSPSRLKWLYERGFGRGASVVAAYDGDKKVTYFDPYRKQSNTPIIVPD